MPDQGDEAISSELVADPRYPVHVAHEEGVPVLTAAGFEYQSGRPEDACPKERLHLPTRQQHSLPTFLYQTTATALLFQGSTGDTTCGVGIAWSVDKASGAVANGGSQLFASVVGGGNLQSAQVAACDFLYFVVSPGLFADNSCDSTGLAVAIVAR